MALAIRGLAVTYGDGHRVEAHAHGWGQLVYAARGAILVAASDAEWLVPPARAVWIPPNHAHALRARGAAALRTLYLAPRICTVLPTVALSLDVSPLLGELIRHAVAHAPLDDDDPAARMLKSLLAAELAASREPTLRLRLPRDRRALRACDLIRRHPDHELSLVDLADHAGVTVRTLQRLILDQTGLRVSEWRQAARLQHATDLLLQGAGVTEAALACGYASVSAFVAAFKRRHGQTPLRYRNRLLA